MRHHSRRPSQRSQSEGTPSGAWQPANAEIAKPSAELPAPAVRDKNDPSQSPSTERPIWKEEFDRVQETLQERELLHSALVSQATDSIVLIDAQTLRFIEFNDATCKRLGYTREEFASLRLTDIQAVLSPKEVSDRMANIVKAGGGSFENRHRCKDGSVRDIRTSNRTVRVRDCIFLVTIWTDITERKTHEREIERLNRLYAGLSALNQMVTRVTSRNELFQEVCRITAAQAGFKAVWIGLPNSETHAIEVVTRAGECLGYLDHIAAPANHRGKPRDQVDVCMRSGKPSIHNNLADDPRLATWHEAAHAYNLHSAAILPFRFRGEVCGVFTVCAGEPDVFRDKEVSLLEEAAAAISFALDGLDREEQRRRAEEQLKNYAADLEIANKALEKAKQLAEAANRAKSEFLANMSHEIRTPMTAILGFGDLLLTPGLSNEEQESFLDGIRRNGRALLELINAILDLSRIEADRLTLEKVDCALQPTVDAVVATARNEAGKKGLRFAVDYEFPLPESIHTEPARLRQVLANLLGNAVKFTERGEVRMTVRCLPQDDQTAIVQFVVADTGIGIPPEKTAELFQPFMQADTSATRLYGGVGLGLAISSRLAKALGGRIDVVSEVGKGSAFTLTIDVGSLKGVHMVSAPPAAPTDETSRSGAARPGLRGRVLLAEDDSDIQTIMRLHLQRLRLEVDVADDGRMACDMFEQAKADGRPYNLIFMDIQMPRMNGYEATQRLRQLGCQLPIVALTAHALAGDREKCLAAGCDDYLAKPVFISGLREILWKYLGRPVAPPGPFPDAAVPPPAQTCPEIEPSTASIS